MSNTVVVHIGRPGQQFVYIGRPGPWGNPFKIGPDGTREEVVAKYRVWLLSYIQNNPHFYHGLRELRGKRLGCFCKPKACHGDVIVELLEGKL